MSHKWVREIGETVPNSTAAVIDGISELQRFYRAYIQSSKTAFAVLSKEKARDGYCRYPTVQWNQRRGMFLCPECREPILVNLSKDGVCYLGSAEAPDFLRENRENHKCKRCGAILWAPLLPGMQTDWVKVGEFGFVHRKFPQLYSSLAKDPKTRERLLEIQQRPTAAYAPVGAVRRFALSSYIRRKMTGRIDGVICDELHQYNNASGQGDAMGDIVRTADKVVGMTATLINGYASGIFHLLYRLFPRLMELDRQSYAAPSHFSNEYGVVESVYEVRGGDYNDNRRTSKRKLRERKLPGVSSLVYSRFLLENAAFLSLSDMGKDLPEYEEIPVELQLREDVRGEYKRLEAEFRSIMQSRQSLSRSVMSAFLGLLTVYPDQPYGQPPICDPKHKENILAAARDLSDITELQQKDIKLLELVSRKLQAGERVLVYTSWVRIDTQKKLEQLFAQRGYPAAVLPASVPPQKREEWVEKQLAAGIRILITNPSLVETGLDLNAFTTIVYYNIAYNLFTLRQSSRRSWRINQTAPRIEVYFFFYAGTIQARAMRLMASKLVAAGVLEGNVTDEGLSAMSDCRDLTSQLARELTLGIQDEVENLSAVFKKMAILKPSRETRTVALEAAPLAAPPLEMVSPDRPISTPVQAPLEQPSAYSEPIPLFASSSNRRRRPKEPFFCGDQLSFFDQPA